jgi:hypothetical protein
MKRAWLTGAMGWLFLFNVSAQLPPVGNVEGQPLGANAERILQALQFLGAPLPNDSQDKIRQAARDRDAFKLQELLDPLVLVAVQINPELRVKVSRGPLQAQLQQDGYTPCLIKILNGGTVAERLRVSSTQAGPVYAGAALGILERQQQTQLNENENRGNDSGRFLDLEMFGAPPMTERLSGLEVEYAILLIYSSEAGRREATIGFDVGRGTQDLGFRGEVPVLFEVQPAIPVKVSIKDENGLPTVARLTIRDQRGRIYPPQAKRLAPDLFFQPHIYRQDGSAVLLPPGEFEVLSTRGPEYVERVTHLSVPTTHQPAGPSLEIQLRRWVDPTRSGFYCGDHHIHGAGCSHYQVPTEGVTPRDMFMQVKGEGLHVGCVLTWGPCYDYQRRYFAPIADTVSEPLTILKYDLEISGFGSQALGHVCLLNLTNQTYPGSEGTKIKGWPTWTVPVLRWAKEQGGVTGYPHSDLFIDAAAYAQRQIKRLDRNGDRQLDLTEARAGLLPKEFNQIDQDKDGRLTVEELQRCADQAAEELPNLVLPAMGGAGAMEIFVSTAEGVCDFISAMNTARIGEWNTWYHLMNCGLPLKVSGETDFPCMSSLRVGQGRVYVKLADGPLERLDFSAWCKALGQGRSYVSDGYAHALAFTVNGVAPGFGEVQLANAGKVTVQASVSFAAELPQAVAYGTLEPNDGKRHAGDTRVLHAPRSSEVVAGGERLVELVRNGEVVARAKVPADGAPHELKFEVEVDRSSWVALRQFPQLHTNPVNVLVHGRPIRSSASARWCAESVELLWENRSRHIAEPERATARSAYDRAVALFKDRQLE